MRYLLSAFSLSMLETFPANVSVCAASQRVALAFISSADVESAVGHESTASLIGSLLGVEKPASGRRNVTLKKGDEALVFQYTGPRLPEGATELPESATFTWLLVRLVD